MLACKIIMDHYETGDETRIKDEIYLSSYWKYMSRYFEIYDRTQQKLLLIGASEEEAYSEVTALLKEELNEAR
jgi:hypothetical protein